MIQAISRISPRRLAQVGCMAAAIALAGPAAADVIVVRSTGPSAKLYPPGKALAEKAPITLAAGDILTMIVANRARTFRGPGIFSPDLSVRTAAVRAAPDTRRRAIGASRTRPPGELPGTWEIDVSQSGKACVADPKKVTLWRPDAVEADRVSIMRPGGATQTLTWPAQQRRLAWPASVPIAEGADYQFRLAGNPDVARVQFVPLSAVPTDISAVARLLIEKGCQNQLDALVEKAAEDTP